MGHACVEMGNASTEDAMHACMLGEATPRTACPVDVAYARTLDGIWGLPSPCRRQAKHLHMRVDERLRIQFRGYRDAVVES